MTLYHPAEALSIPQALEKVVQEIRVQEKEERIVTRLKGESPVWLHVRSGQ